MVIATVLSGIIQVLVFAFVPFIVYLATARRQRRFAEYIGLKRAPARAAGWGVLIGMASFPLMLGLLHVAGAADVLADPASQTGRLRELAEARGVAAMLFVAVFQAAVTTALSEEILFRGFLAKRLVSRLGFGAGNTLQALVFGAVHSVLLTGTATGDVRAFARSLGGGGAPARRARLADGLAQRAPRGRLHRPRLVRPHGVQRVDVYGRADSYITRSAVNMQRAQAVVCGLDRFLAGE